MEKKGVGSINISLKEAKSQFTQIEAELDLFNLKINGVYVWEYIRFPLFNKVLESIGLWGTGLTELKLETVDFARMSLEAAKNIFLKNALVGSKKEILIIGTPRKKLQPEGDYLDLYVDFLNESLPFKTQVVDSYSKNGHVGPTRNKSVKYLDFLMAAGSIYSWLSKKPLNPDEKTRAQEIRGLIKSYFGADIDVEVLISQKLAERKMSRWVWKRLLRVYRPKLIIEECYYGVSKMALNELCKEMGIPTVELQHGVLNQYHLAYDFPKLKRKLVTFPDYLLLFGKYWKGLANFPIDNNHIFITGYPYMEHEIRKYPNKKKNQIVFLSQVTVGESLSKMAIEFAKTANGQKYDIVYKLHPHEYATWAKRYPWLMESKGLRVIDKDQPSLYEIFANSESQVGVDSTALYEGLAFGLKTYLVPVSGYTGGIDLIERGLAMNADDAKELSKQIYAQPKKRVSSDYFFEGGSLEKQVTAIKKILSGA